MSVLSQVIRELREVERDLQDQPLLARRIRESVAVLEGEEIQWIGTTRAKRLLGIGSENTIKAWARLGLLRSRREANGRLKVRLDDVLAQQVLRAALTGDGDDSEMTPEEYAVRGTVDLEDMSPDERMLVERARTLWAGRVGRAGEDANEAAFTIPGHAITAPAHEEPDRSPR